MHHFSISQSTDKGGAGSVLPLSKHLVCQERRRQVRSKCALSRAPKMATEDRLLQSGKAKTTREALIAVKKPQERV